MKSLGHQAVNCRNFMEKSKTPYLAIFDYCFGEGVHVLFFQAVFYNFLSCVNLSALQTCQYLLRFGPGAFHFNFCLKNVLSSFFRNKMHFTQKIS